MKAVGCVVYEIDLNEIQKLPDGWQVLRLDTLYQIYKIMHAGEDVFKQEEKRYVYFLFDMPPLPKLNATFSKAVAQNG